MMKLARLISYTTCVHISGSAYFGSVRFSTDESQFLIAAIFAVVKMYNKMLEKERNRVKESKKAKGATRYEFTTLRRISLF
jgi:large-conductance mechanosensitive channel